jgi:hypothetical protein
VIESDELNPASVANVILGVSIPFKLPTKVRQQLTKVSHVDTGMLEGEESPEEDTTEAKMEAMAHVPIFHVGRRFHFLKLTLIFLCIPGSPLPRAHQARPSQCVVQRCWHDRRESEAAYSRDRQESQPADILR